MKMETPAGLSRKLLSYSIGAGAAAMAATSARGDFHLTDFSADPVTADTIYFNLMDPAVLSDSTGADFELNCKSNGNGVGSKNKGKNIGISTGAETVKSTGFYQAELALNTTIGSGSSFGNEFGYMGATENGKTYGDWKVGDRGYLGLEISVTDPNTMLTKTLYGWADVSLNNLPVPVTAALTTNAPVTPCFTLYAYAYEDDGTPILAGAPEPKSTVALLIAGAAGAVALRRRRASAQG